MYSFISLFAVKFAIILIQSGILLYFHISHVDQISPLIYAQLKCPYILKM